MSRYSDERRSQGLREADGRGAVLAHHANSGERVLGRDAENRADHAAARLEPLRAQIMSSDVTPGVAASVLGYTLVYILGCLMNSSRFMLSLLSNPI